ncbi:hypothetical protein BBO_08951 [Beauveria brongniartii RCEF 3172]|uniref:DUF7732 domain-containing protein n=1 Tax=Beauveria brongniartii RCEF 3172 TaxID=1081107 RepID=A0A166WR12_9HYPO|nr:hypothetical protein BBO_08951 [Beauveria brongniartii RCEF 3172]
MRLDHAVVALSLLTSASAAAVGDALNIARVDVQEHDLFKRKGGGAGGGRGGGSSGSRGGSSGSSSSGSSGSSGNRGSSGSGSSNSGNRGSSSSAGNRGSPSNTGSNVNSGGTTRAGSGPQPRFGGGQYYSGGSRVPFAAGSTRNGIVPGLLIGSALAFWPALWLSGAYMYNYHDPYRFRNESNNNKDEELPVICGCAEGAACSCDDSGNTTATLNELVGNGSYAGLNKSVVTVGTKDGQKVLLINGTLPNGTTAQGDEDKDADGNSTESSASAAVKTALENMGLWPVVLTAVAIVFAA